MCGWASRHVRGLDFGRIKNLRGAGKNSDREWSVGHSGRHRVKDFTCTWVGLGSTPACACWVGAHSCFSSIWLSPLSFPLKYVGTFVVCHDQDKSELLHQRLLYNVVRSRPTESWFASIIWDSTLPPQKKKKIVFEGEFINSRRIYCIWHHHVLLRKHHT